MEMELRTLLYRLCRMVCRALFFPTCQIEVCGLSNDGPPFDLDGPLILAGNHISHFDPPLLGSVLRSPVDFMAMQELFSTPVSAWLFHNIFAIPVDRSGSGMSAVREALMRLQAGRMICIFPEGGLRTGDSSILEHRPCPPGAALLALQSRVPVLPFIIIGTDRLYAWQCWFRSPKVLLLFGQRLNPVDSKGKRRNQQEFNDTLDAEIKRLYVAWKNGLDFDEIMIPRTAQERWAEEGSKV
ncbi:MAG: lysophospholipid acyltransferase family protein [Candidatus Methylacidiphilales bacterium]